MASRYVLVLDENGDSYRSACDGSSPLYEQIQKIVGGPTPISIQLPELFRFKAFGVRKDHELLMFACEQKQNRTFFPNPWLNNCKGSVVFCLLGADGNIDSLTLAEINSLPKRLRFIPPQFPQF